MTGTPVSTARANLALPLAAVVAAIIMFQVGASLGKFLFASVGPIGSTALREGADDIAEFKRRCRCEHMRHPVIG